MANDPHDHDDDRSQEGLFLAIEKYLVDKDEGSTKEKRNTWNGFFVINFMI